MRKIENELLSIDPTPRKLVVTPTDMKFFEVDGSDARMEKSVNMVLMANYCIPTFAIRWVSDGWIWKR